MKIFVKVKAGSRENNVKEPALRLMPVDDSTKDYYIVSVKEPPVEGRANDAVVRVLAEYFKVSRTDVVLVSGSTSRTKVFDIKK